LENNKLRHEALQVLHEIQINYLSNWRSLKDQDKELSDEYLMQLLLLVNVLSGGLKGTG
jgi:phosphoenolpyruvate carboxylase